MCGHMFFVLFSVAFFCIVWEIGAVTTGSPRKTECDYLVMCMLCVVYC